MDNDSQKQLAQQMLDILQRDDICPAVIISILEKMLEKIINE